MMAIVLPTTYKRYPLLLQRNHFFSTFRKFSSALPEPYVGMQVPGKNQGFFEYTSGRWLYNEPRRLEERRIVFNVEELKKAAAKSVDRPFSDVLGLSKLAEGGFNRVFEISMKDGSSILARLPYPSTLPRRLAVASEVATMDLARAHGVPTPKVYAYSVDANPVGSEYILMEKLSGKPIGDIWFDLTEKQRIQVLHDVVKFEAKLFNIDLPASGSIYYARDLPSSVGKVCISGTSGGLCVGPYASLRWWFGERSNLDVDRGPHTDARRVLQAPAEKELAWTQAFGRLRYPRDRVYREAFQYQKQDPKEHAKSLVDYLRLASHLLPTDPTLHQPSIRHPDIQPNNIFVSQDFKVTGLIDWQHAVALPSFLAAGIPNTFQNYADEASRIYAPPHLPDNFDSLDETEKTQVQEQFRRRHVHFFYLCLTERINERHWRAIEEDYNILKRRIFDHAGYPWEGLNTPLQYDLAQVARLWPGLVPPTADGNIPPCPVSFTEKEEQHINALSHSHRDGDADMEKINDYLGISSDGWVPHDRFMTAAEKAREMKEIALANVEDDPWLHEMSERHWPFDDCEENE